MSIISKTSIVNDAFDAIGIDNISDIDDTGSPVAVNAKLKFGFVTLILLGMVDWNFNKGRAKLTKESSAPAFGKYLYKFVRPADCLNIRYLCDLASEDIRYEYDLEGQYILSNVEEAYLIYTQDLYSEHEDISKFPPWFCALISAELASRMAAKYTGQNQFFMLSIEKKLAKAWMDATSGNGKESCYTGPLGESEQGSNDVYEGLRDGNA